MFEGGGHVAQLLGAVTNSTVWDILAVRPADGLGAIAFLWGLSRG